MNNEVNKIISVYTTILENKSILQEFNSVSLADTNYSNVKFNNDSTRNDSVNKALLDDIQQAASNVGIVATITTAKSGHSEKTTTGNTSRHSTGAGVDIAKLNGIGSDNATSAMDGNPEFRNLGNKLKDSLVSLGYTWNTESGNPKAVLWQTNSGGNHYNHLHVSNNSGETSEPTNSKDSSELGDLNKNSVTSTLSNLMSTASKSSSQSITPDPLIMAFANKLTSALGLTENINKIKRLL
jgi:hypothetical protein